jgi:DNA-binding transcriptional ArsR family regulator
MPGGRLTQQERQQIALGLADGLAYAEIARHLDRPTSTITREVMRNGGPTAYRADLAHRATERRAHRRRQAAPRRTNGPPQTRGRDAEAVRDYEETFTTLLMQQGLPKMMSRVLTSLYTSDAGNLTASELVARLQVSPASVSKAIARLESQGLVRRERDERRRERYVVDDDVWYQSTIASARPDPGHRDRTAGRRRARPPHARRHPPREHRPLPRFRQREHHPRGGAGPRGPPQRFRPGPHCAACCTARCRATHLAGTSGHA